MFVKMLEIGGRFGIGGPAINLATLILGGAAAYFLTIQSLKLELAGKADDAVVELLDKKLSNIEIMLKESVVSREQFYEFSSDCEARLVRIEYYLTDQAGDNVKKNKR